MRGGAWVILCLGAGACQALVGIRDLQIAVDAGAVADAPIAIADAAIADARRPLADAPIFPGSDAGTPPSCVGLPLTCGPDRDRDCCEAPLVTGGDFDRDGLDFAAAHVSDFRLDRYEITIGRYRQFIASGFGTFNDPPATGTGANPHIGPTSGWQLAWKVFLPSSSASNAQLSKCATADPPLYTDSPTALDDQPMNCMSWYVAFAFCIWDGGRLPTEAEWAYAAQGGADQRTYPWGDGISPDHAKYGCSAPPTPGRAR